MEIISIGRYDLLIEVLNGLAMLTSDAGPAGYGGMVALGLLVGVLLTLARAIVTQKLELQWVLAGWLLYACMFIPKVTVTVRDIYTGATNAVDNVPLGPAAIGSITSQVGVSLADAFGAVFAFPSLTQTGYLDTLDLINSINKMDYGDANDGKLGNNGFDGALVTTVDVHRSLDNYLTKCTLYADTTDLPKMPTWESLSEAPDLLAAIKVESNTWFATMYLTEGRPGGTVMTCRDAYTQLSDFMHATFLPAWQTEIARKLKLPDPAVQIQNAMDSLFGLGKDRQTFMLNALIKKQVELSELGFQAQANNTAGLVMRTQAMEQRRTQWASEQSMFQEMARPLMGYIEAFFYAVSPIMAFTFLLGAVGISLFGRYLLLAIWIQLWMPIMAINNLYVSMAASDRIQSIGAGGFDVLSMTGLDSVWTQTQSWLAVGGMMAGATPLLALMLVTGSYFAFTSLTSRMSGTDAVDEKIGSPNIMSPAAFASVGAMGMQQARYMNDPGRGTRMTDIENLLPKLSVSADARASVSSAQAGQEKAEQQWSSMFAHGVDLTTQKGQEFMMQNLHNVSLGSGQSHTDEVVKQMTYAAAGGKSSYDAMSQQEKDAVLAGVNLGIQLGLRGMSSKGTRHSSRSGESQRVGGSGKKGGTNDYGPDGEDTQELGGRVSHGTDEVIDQAGKDKNRSNSAGGGINVEQVLGHTHSFENGERREIAERIEDMVSKRDGYMARLDEAVRQDKNEGLSSRFLRMMGINDVDKWTNAYQDSVSAGQQFEEAQVRANMAGWEQHLDLVAAGHAAMTGGWTGKLNDLAYRDRDINKTKLEDLTGSLEQCVSRDNKFTECRMAHEVAQGISAISWIMNKGETETQEALMALLGEKGFATPDVALGDAERNRPLADHAPAIGATRNEVEKRLENHDSGINEQDLRTQVQQKLELGETLQKKGEEEVLDHFAGGQVRNQDMYVRQSRDLDKARESHATNFYKDQGNKDHGEVLGALTKYHNYDLGGNLQATVGGWRDTQAALQRHDQAYRHALEKELPDAAARFYADQMQPGITAKQDAERYETEAREVLGQDAFDALKSAADSEAIEHNRKFNEAVAKYKAEHPQENFSLQQQTISPLLEPQGGKPQDGNPLLNGNGSLLQKDSGLLK